MEMIGILPTMKCQLQPMSGTLVGTCHKMSATVQNKFQVSYLKLKCQLLTINVRLVMLTGSYTSYSRNPIHVHETLRCWNVI